MNACKKCGVQFLVGEEEKLLLNKVSPVLGDNTFDYPEPEICRDCRQQKRLAYRNEKTLYRRKCDFCSKTIVSIYHKKVTFPVFCTECYWKDNWNATDLGREYDFERPFFEQFTDLIELVPRLAIVNKQSHNSEYCNYSFANKNCYLTFGNHYEQDSMYGRYSTKNRDCLDYLYLYDSELCYECVFSKNCYRSIYLDHCDDCEACKFSCDLKNCKNCLFCCGLRNKEFYIFNKPYSEKDYRKYIKDLNLVSHSQWEKILSGWEKFKKENGIFKASHQVNSENCIGDEINNSRNLIDCFSCSNCEDCINGFQMDETYSSYENSHLGYDRCELSYNCIGCSGTYACSCCDSCWHCSNLYYSNLCFSTKNSFGCIGLKQQEYCVLNRQYSEKDYYEILPRIIDHMRSTGEWGDFFDFNVSPFSYNETVALEYFPLSKDEIVTNGWRYKEPEDLLKHPQPVDLPDSILDTDEQICDFVLACESTGRPYKILSKEFKFYKQMKIPIPRLSPDQRHVERHLKRNPARLWQRNCFKCKKSIMSSFSPERPEKIYCDDCYLSLIY